jgi:lipopolysaccharide export system permease protein
MKRTQVYITLRLLKPFLLVTVAALGIASLLRIAQYLFAMIDAGVAAATFVHMIVLLTPTLLLLVLPGALFISVVFVYAEMSGDNEIVALRASGLSHVTLALPAAAVALMATVICYAMSLYYMPVGFKRFKDIEFMLRPGLAGPALTQGAFNSLGPDVTIYARERSADGVLHGVLVQDDREAGKSITLVAERAILRQAGERFVVDVEAGNLQELDRAGAQLRVAYFDRYTLTFDSSVLFGVRRRGIAERHIGELLDPPTASRRDRELGGEMRAEGHQRLAAPLLNLSFAAIALAVLFGGEYQRRGRAPRIALGGVLVVAFESAHLGVTSLAADLPALLPLIYLNAIVPGLAAAALVWAGDRHAPGRGRLGRLRQRLMPPPIANRTPPAVPAERP